MKPIELIKTLDPIRKRIVYILGGVLLVAGLYDLYHKIDDAFAPCGKKDHISGKLLPAADQNTPTYYVDLGAFNILPISIKELEEGTKLSDMGLVSYNCEDGGKPMDLSLKVSHGKIVLSVTIRDLDGTVLGRLNDSRWEIKPNNITACDDSPTHLEVLDKKGNMVFRYENLNDTIHVRGYFLGGKCSVICVDGMTFLGSGAPFDSVTNQMMKRNKIKYCNFFKNDDN